MVVHLLLLSVLSDDISLLTYHSAWRTELFSTLWFLKCLFICYAIYMALCVTPKPYRGILTILALLVIPFIRYYRLLFMFPCFLLGVEVHKHNHITKFNTIIQIISAPIFALCLVFWDSSAFTLSRVSFQGLMNGDYISLGIFLKQYLFVLLTGMSGALFCSSFLYWCFRKFDNSELLHRISGYGTYTLGIYILQTFLLETILSKYLKIDLYFSPFVCNVVIIPLISIIIIFICILLVKLINCNKYLSSILLGYNKGK